MKNRVIAGVAALAVVLALVGLAVVAGRDSDTEPEVLPVLGAGGGAATQSADSSMRVAPTRFEAGKLPGLAEEADAWTLSATGADVAAIARLADVLGVEGEVTATDAGWSVGTDARRLDVQAVAGLPWSLFESAPPVACIKAPCETVTTSPACPPDTPCTSEPSPGQCAADDCPLPMEARRPADLPSREEAESTGRTLLTRLGVDLDQATVRVDDSITIWNVVADPVVGGLPTVGFTTSVGIGAKGAVQYANGWLASPVKGDRYPLIGTAAGVERLDDEQARILIAPAEPGCEGCETEPRVVRITGVRLGLQLFSTFEKGAEGHLVPSYLFSTEDGGELPVVAVADRYLGRQPAPEPDGHGTPAEPGAAGECSGTGTTKDVTTSLSVQVCGPTTARVGEVVTLTVTGKGTFRDDCGSPVPEWGDGSDVAVCDIGCESLPAEPRELSREFEHTYEAAGTYAVVIHFRGCGADMGTDLVTLQKEVRVEG